MVLVSAGVLFGRAAHALADFERDLVAEVGRRWLDDRRAALVTEREWPVIEDAIEAMRREVSRQLEQLGAEQSEPV
jgi:hypothetical protein